MTKLDPDHVAWCRRQFDFLRPQGAWGIPRSGLIFKKTGPAQLTLINTMPWESAMPITAAQLKEQQDGDFTATQEHFAAAGIEVIRGPGAA